MESRKIVELLSHADSPVLAATRWWSARENTHPEASQILLEVVAKGGRANDANSLREISRMADSWASRNPGAVVSVIDALEKLEMPAAGVLAAALAESAGNARRAAGLFRAAEQRLEGEARAFSLLGLARTLSGTDEKKEAIPVLMEAIRETSAARTLNGAASLLRRLGREGELPSRRKCRIGVVGNVTFDLLVATLKTTLFGHGVAAEFWSGGFGQYQQEILDPNSGLARFQPEIVIIACDWRALGLPEESADASAAVQAKVAEFEALWRVCRERLHAHVIQFAFEIPPHSPYGRLSATLAGGKARVLREINQAFFDAETKSRGLTIADIDQVAGMAGKRRWHAPALWFVAKQHPAADMLPELARLLAALVRAVVGLTAKCVALDLDGTLWGGVIGEDGMNNLRLGGANAGEAFVAFQQYLRELKRRGVLLAVCSKNNEADARLPFESHPEMVLRLEDISAFVANWNPKDQNLREIARKLNIGLDSIVFVDDNPVERRWIKRQVPEVQVVDLPEDPAEYIEAIERQLPFEALAISEEDRQRSETFKANADRDALRTASTTVGEFLAALEMTVELRSFDEANLPRITQLINKTNQFNVTTRRMLENQVAGLIGAPGAYTQAMRLRDRYGDYGLTGALVARAEKDVLRIDVWLLSCRVMGRRIEDVMLAALLRHAREAGFSRVVGEFIPSAKNAPVQDLFPRLGFAPLEKPGSESRFYEWDLARTPEASPSGIAILDQTAPLSAATS